MPNRRSRKSAVTYLDSAFETGGPGLDFSDVPATLNERAQGEWKRIGEVFAEAEEPRFRETDRAALTAYCTYWELFLGASEDVNSRGPVVNGRSSSGSRIKVKNPSLVIMREASVQLRYWLRELAFTPDSRGRTGILDEVRRQQGADDDDEWP
jgi:P27 family predicted phage terminase small subunit